MADPIELYQKEVIRARFAWRGVPPQDQWDQLDPIEREVAAEMTDEDGNEQVGERAESLRTMDQAVAAMLITIDDGIPDAPLTPDRVDEVIGETVRPAFAQASQATESALTGGVNRGMETAIQAHKRALGRASAEVGLEVSDDAIRNMMERVAERRQGRQPGGTGPQLIRRRFVGALDDTETFIRDNVGRPGRETARQLLSDLGDHPRIQRALEDEGPRGERVRRAIQRAGVAGDQIGREGRSMYVNSKRAMADQLTRAQHEADVLTAEESPAVKTLRWRRSTRHPTLQSSPDVCDGAAELDVHGLGEGLYYPGAAPSLLHPFDECAVIPQPAPPEEWGELAYPEGAVPNTEPREVEPNEMSAVLRSNITASSGDVTANKISRATRTYNTHVAIAYDEFVDY